MIAEPGRERARENEPESAGARDAGIVVQPGDHRGAAVSFGLDSNVRPRLALEAMVVAWPNSEPRDR